MRIPGCKARDFFCPATTYCRLICYYYLNPHFMKSYYFALILLFSAGCQQNNTTPPGNTDSLRNALQQVTAERDLIAQRLQRFDSLDFDFYSHQQWDSLSISHAADIIVTYPDGNQTRNLPTHIKELEPLFVFAPDTKINAHPVKFGSGDWTCVIGEMTGTFSKPMPLGNGKSIAPTGKSFKLSMCTVGHWQGGKMTEEMLFWDNAALMQQIGLGK